MGFGVWGLGFRVWGLGFRGLGFRVWGLGFRGGLGGGSLLGGQGDLVSRLIMGITGVTLWVIGFTNLLTTSP